MKFFSKKKLFQKLSLSKIPPVSNIWDLDQTRSFIGPDLSPNCLQRLSADNTGRLRVISANVILVAHGWIYSHCGSL